jgi:hypothetical protein
MAKVIIICWMIAAPFLLIAWINMDIEWYKTVREKNAIETMCYIYTRKGEPESILINGDEYRLKPDGTLRDPQDQIMMHPVDREIMARNNCIRINLGD